MHKKKGNFSGGKICSQGVLGGGKCATHFWGGGLGGNVQQRGGFWVRK